jgi:hypothetical protein
VDAITSALSRVQGFSFPATVKTSQSLWSPPQQAGNGFRGVPIEEAPRVVRERQNHNSVDAELDVETPTFVDYGSVAETSPLEGSLREV